MQQLVSLRAGLISKPAVIELRDDNQFLLYTVDKKTNASIEMIMNEPVGSLRVSGNQSFLVLSSPTNKRRVEFTNPNQLTGLLAGGLIGAAVADAYANPSGIRSWVDALGSRGAAVRYSGMSLSMKIILITFAVVMASVAVLAGIAALLKN